jgi:hypothetical protein
MPKRLIQLKDACYLFFVAFSELSATKNFSKNNWEIINIFLV